MRFAGLGRGIGSYMPETPRYDKVGAMSVMDSAEDEANQAMNNALTADAVMRGKASIASAEAYAPAIRAGGEGRGAASAAAGFQGAGPVLGKLFSGGLGGGGGSGGYNFDFFNSRGAFG